MAEFYIYSVKHSRGEAVWWKPDCSGYTKDLASAGVYSEEKAKEIVGAGPDVDSVAVPVELKAEFKVKHVVDTGWGLNGSIIRDLRDKAAKARKDAAACPHL